MLPDDDVAVIDDLDRRVERKQKVQEKADKEHEELSKKEKASKDKDKDEGKEENAKWKSLHMDLAEKRGLSQVSKNTGCILILVTSLVL